MNYQRIFELFPYQMARFPQQVALAIKEQGQWRTFSTTECIEWINRVSAALLDMGLTKGDAVAILSETGSPWWNFVDFGAQQIGLITVPIHAVAYVEDIRFILEEAKVKVIFCADKDLYEKAMSALNKEEQACKLFTFEKSEGFPFWEEVLPSVTTIHLQHIAQKKQDIFENDLATIIYTSGTSGQPKGVMLSHRNIISNIKSTIVLLPVNHEKTTISFLPLSHVFERMVTYAYIAVGASVYYLSAVEQLMENVKEVRPHYFTTVPRILEKMHEGLQQMAQDKGGWRKRLILWALNLGTAYPDSGNPSLMYRFQLFWADLFVYRKWRALLGKRVEGIMVGASALQPDLGRLFEAAGIRVREGYGLTETSPVLSFNRFEPGGLHFGTVGIPIPGVDIRIEASDENGAGEILARGPNIMLGYYNRPEETAAVMGKDGWFRTGDVGLFVHKRFLKITGRKKDIFKTSAGKYIAPDALERKVTTSPYIEHCLIIGVHRPFLAALLVPNYQKLEEWCLENKVHWTAPQFMAVNTKVIKFIQIIIDEINSSLSNTEKIKKFTLLHENWSTGSGELTPTLKLRRNFIVEKFDKEIEELFTGTIAR
jgi:long-chain acyl-CoA synthetase